MHPLYCDLENTYGQVLYSGNVYDRQISCIPDVQNAGKLYSWPTGTAGGNAKTQYYSEPNSICSKGWQLVGAVAEDKKSYYSLIDITYNVHDNSDRKVIIHPFSFVRAGRYSAGIHDVNTEIGYYLTSVSNGANTPYNLTTKSSYLGPRDTYSGKNTGMSLRCGGVAENT